MTTPDQASRNETQKELDDEVRHRMARKSRRSFLIGGAAALAVWGGYEWLAHAPQMGELKSPLRFAEHWNADVSRALFRDAVLAPTYPRSAATPLRLNGDIGLEDVAPDRWRLQVVGLDRPDRYPQFTPDVDLWDYQSADQSSNLLQGLASAGENVKGPSPAQQAAPSSTGMTKTPGILLTMADIRKLPRFQQVTQFKCIEGWSQICSWEGARFRDFMKAYPPKLNSGGSLPKYVAMETPDGEYFTGYNMASMVNPQTLLCYEMGGVPLSPGHGAPLRLAMPLKYGYKQIKQIAKITYTNQKPQDYWAQNGYDWYGGL